jgi:hypothetical protein
MQWRQTRARKPEIEFNFLRISFSQSHLRHEILFCFHVGLSNQARLFASEALSR